MRILGCLDLKPLVFLAFERHKKMEKPKMSAYALLVPLGWIWELGGGGSGGWGAGSGGPLPCKIYLPPV